QPTLTSAQKDRIKSILPKPNYKIIAATLARIYYAYPNPKEWSYAGLQGALILVHDRAKGGYWFRLIDLSGTRGVTWEHEVHDSLRYKEDRPFFHSFAGDECVIGFIFAEKAEAGALYKKVINRKLGMLVPYPQVTRSTSRSGKVDRSLISMLKMFRHVAHIGYGEKAGFVSHGVDETWQQLLD
ncbi:hypothetical protein BOTBODRAFT_115466, partial [Botryobasidium botryosum FD-172 SS1]